MQIGKNNYDRLVKITKSHKPNECCAILFEDKMIRGNYIIRDVTKYAKSLSPSHFGEIDPEHIGMLIEVYGIPKAIFHSHPCEVFISSVDILYMIPTVQFWNCIWLVMSDKYELKAFTLSKNDTAFWNKEPVEIPITILCGRCHGYGEVEYKPRNDPAETTEIRICPRCNGDGKSR